ncbi:hypothetical protein, partial [Listeria monocytogenes]
MTWKHYLSAWQNADLSNEWRRELQRV